MATILIFSENWQIAHKLCDSYARKNTTQDYAAILTRFPPPRMKTARP